jgi:uncharacterized protein YjbJ (UPF0337 family)
MKLIGTICVFLAVGFVVAIVLTQDRVDEVKGSIKQGFGKVTGNQEMEAEGKAEHDSAVARRQVKGAANQVKGKIEEGLGRVTGNEEMQDRGTADRIKGDIGRIG